VNPKKKERARQRRALDLVGLLVGNRPVARDPFRVKRAATDELLLSTTSILGANGSRIEVVRMSRKLTPELDALRQSLTEAVKHARLSYCFAPNSYTFESLNACLSTGRKFRSVVDAVLSPKPPSDASA
jgi:hypothetical protein